MESSLSKGEIDHRNALVPKSQPCPQGFFFLDILFMKNFIFYLIVEREGLETRVWKTGKYPQNEVYRCVVHCNAIFTFSI